MWQTLKNLNISPRLVRNYLIFLVIVGVLHHIDHALRYDHSGWPIRPSTGVPGAGYVTPFSYSLLIYPLIATFFFIKSKAYRIAGSFLIIAAVWVTHLTIESPLHI